MTSCDYVMESKISGSVHGTSARVAMDVTIRESADSLCRDGADTPIVRVHTKAF